MAVNWRRGVPKALDLELNRLILLGTPSLVDLYAALGQVVDLDLDAMPLGLLVVFDLLDVDLECISQRHRLSSEQRQVCNTNIKISTRDYDMELSEIGCRGKGRCLLVPEPSMTP